MSTEDMFGIINDVRDLTVITDLIQLMDKRRENPYWEIKDMKHHSQICSQLELLIPCLLQKLGALQIS